MRTKGTAFIVELYVAGLAAFLLINTFLPPVGETARWPEFAPRARNDSAHLWDTVRLAHSVAHLPAVRLLRQTGHSLRILLGQSLDWIIWGDGYPPVLAPKIELPLSRGMGNAGVKANLDHLILRLGQYSRKLRDDGWILVVVPVPTKLSIYRESFHWPLLDSDLLTRDPVATDQADGLMYYMLAELRARNVAAVDLQSLFRAEHASHPNRWLYPPGESHWSGYGLRLAAEATADMIHDVAGITRIVPVPLPRPADHYGDIAVSFDPLPSWPSRLQGSYYFKDNLSTWPVYTPTTADAKSASLIAVLGTSYTGQYSWIVGEPVGFASALGAQFRCAVIRQISQTGIGGYHPFRTFLERRDKLVEEFCRATSQAPAEARKIVVWEFPMRDFGYLTAHNEANIIRIENPNGIERLRDRDLFWIGATPAMLSIVASEDGVVDFSAELHPGPSLPGLGPRGTLVIINERGERFIARVPGGLQHIRVPVAAGLNHLQWGAAEALTPPAAGSGDPRTLGISVYDLHLTYHSAETLAP